MFCCGGFFVFILVTFVDDNASDNASDNTSDNASNYASHNASDSASDNTSHNTSDSDTWLLALATLGGTTEIGSYLFV
jgi:hypothetical protein